MKRPILIFILASLVASQTWAASESREKQMLRRMQQQVQQVEQARAQAEQDKAAVLADQDKLTREVEKLRSEHAAARRERAARNHAERELEGVKAELESLRAKLADAEKQLADSQARLQVTTEERSRAESSWKKTQSDLEGRVRELNACRSHNGRLYGLGREMMQKYRDKSCHDALTEAEPFTGLKKVEVENLLETWRDRLDSEKLSAHP